MSILIAVVAGVFAGVLANLATNIFVTVLVPAYRDYVYRGVRVDGDWVVRNIGTPSDGRSLTDSWQLSVRLTQKAYRLSGAATALRAAPDREGAVDILHYNVEGTVQDRFVIVQMRTLDRNRIAHSAFHLEIVGDGNMMRGHRTFYGLIMNQIRSIRSEWSRHGATHALPLLSATTESSREQQVRSDPIDGGADIVLPSQSGHAEEAPSDRPSDSGDAAADRQGSA